MFVRLLYSQMTVRLSEIDALRGIAVLGMIFFHAAFDMKLLGVLDFEPYGWPLIIFVRIVQFLFLGLAGISVALSSRKLGGQMKRGAWIFLCGMLVSLGTWIVFPEDFVKFGVLHFIGIAVPVVALFKGRPLAAMGAAVISFMVGEYFLGFSVETEWLFPLGLLAPGFSSLDYFPIFPWLAAPLIGLVLGEYVYGARRPVLERIPGFRLFLGSPLARVGRHSLAIYLLHQPILYFSLWGLLVLLR